MVTIIEAFIMVFVKMWDDIIVYESICCFSGMYILSVLSLFMIYIKDASDHQLIFTMGPYLSIYWL